MDVVVRVNDAVNGFVWGGFLLWSALSESVCGSALRLVSFRFADSDMR